MGDAIGEHGRDDLGVVNRFALDVILLHQREKSFEGFLRVPQNQHEGRRAANVLSASVGVKDCENTCPRVSTTRNSRTIWGLTQSR